MAMAVMTLRLEPLAETHIAVAAEDAIRLARKLDVVVDFNFNGVLLSAHRNSTPEGLEAKYEEGISKIWIDTGAGNPCVVNPDELEGMKVECDRYKQAAEELSRWVYGARNVDSDAVGIVGPNREFVSPWLKTPEDVLMFALELVDGEE